MGLHTQKRSMGKVTLKEKYHALLADLLAERKHKDNEDSWNYRLDQKIEQLKVAIKEAGYE